jgi:hypothetical protein
MPIAGFPKRHSVVAALSVATAATMLAGSTQVQGSQSIAFAATGAYVRLDASSKIVGEGNLWDEMFESENQRRAFSSFIRLSILAVIPGGGIGQLRVQINWRIGLLIASCR